ncbi:hypothetical protein B0H34DRAFT_675095 [Crassisporium funariophilum]|nr:hypothetical protein B0H34DRAFT_675095 [Crassisporium funariophilum]
MQLIAFATLLSIATIASAVPLPVNPGDVHMAKPNKFIPPQAGKGANIPHPVVALATHDTKGHVPIVIGSHNLPQQMKADSKPANDYTKHSTGAFTDKHVHGQKVPTALSVGHPTKIHHSDLLPMKNPSVPHHLSGADMKHLHKDVGDTLVAKAKAKIAAGKK